MCLEWRCFNGVNPLIRRHSHFRLAGPLSEETRFLKITQRVSSVTETIEGRLYVKGSMRALVYTSSSVHPHPIMQGMQG